MKFLPRLLVVVKCSLLSCREQYLLPTNTDVKKLEKKLEKIDKEMIDAEKDLQNDKLDDALKHCYKVEYKDNKEKMLNELKI